MLLTYVDAVSSQLYLLILTDSSNEGGDELFKFSDGSESQSQRDSQTTSGEYRMSVHDPQSREQAGGKQRQMQEEARENAR